MQAHRWYAAKACPGDYLMERFPEIAKIVTERLGGNGSESTPSTTATSAQVTTSCPYTVRVTDDSLNIRSGSGVNFDVVGVISDRGVYTITEENNGWGKLKSGVGWISLKYTVRA